MLLPADGWMFVGKSIRKLYSSITIDVPEIDPTTVLFTKCALVKLIVALKTILMNRVTLSYLDFVKPNPALCRAYLVKVCDRFTFINTSSHVDGICHSLMRAYMQLHVLMMSHK
jgi:hypothetical protein